MLLEKLREYTLGQSDALPAGYQNQAIRYVFHIDASGRYIGVVDTADTANRRRGAEHLAPHIKRSSGIAPKLLADTGEYVLGMARDDPKKPSKPERVTAQHEAFVALVNACAEATNEPAVRTVRDFLRGSLPSTDQLGEDFDPSAMITFRVSDPNRPEGILPIHLPAVQAFWASYVTPESGPDGTDEMACFLCGTVGSVLERHPLKIRGIPGGQILKDLISANAPAFESYGLRASEIAPTCLTCAEAYGNGLNALLGSKTTSLWTKELAYAFWTEKSDAEAAPIVVGFFTEPEAHAGEVRNLLTAFYTGKSDSLAIDPTKFYAAAFGASGARVVVKDWVDTTVGAAKQHLARYFALQDLVQWDGFPGNPVPVSWLANSTVHRKATAPPIVSRSLVRLALAGTPLPLDLLFLAVRQNRAEQKVTRERAMLIKMVIGSRRSYSPEEMLRMTTLDPADNRPAYLCGRLLATLDRIQYLALGSTNATIVDKFYGTASSAPASVFGTLLHGAQNHLAKVRRDRPGAHKNLEEQLETILVPMKTFPMTLTLQDQGLFALGFYHQRAADRARSAANKAKREAQAEPAVSNGAASTQAE